MSAATSQLTKIVSQEEWLAARQQLLAKEKKLTRELDALAAQRRQLPWVRVEKDYVFDSPSGKKTLAELFSGRSQLIVYHFMFGPQWEAGCLGCSFVADHIDGVVTHLANRDVTLVAVSRAPQAKIEAFKSRMGWRFKWYSSFGSDFNWDYKVSFSKDEVSSGNIYYNYQVQKFSHDEGQGLSAFYKDPSGNIFHTYSAYGRGVEPLLGTYGYLDLAPKGRDEGGLSFPMAWVRYHDSYDSNYFSEASESAAGKTAHACCSGTDQ